MGLINNHDAVLFDLDGVLYAGSQAIPAAPAALSHLRELGVRCAFVTNNASRSAEQIAAHLRELAVSADAEEVFSSAPAGVAMLAREVAPGARVLVTGSATLRRLVEDAGYAAVESSREQPEAVIQGFDPSLSWSDLAEASYAINQGAAWFATNLDRSVPRERGIAPANGALVEAVSFATGIHPQAAGKPEPLMFLRAAEAVGAQQPLVVGDRLDTDVLGGNRAGFTTALVLTGATTAAEARASVGDQRPDVVLDTLHDLFTDQHWIMT